MDLEDYIEMRLEEGDDYEVIMAEVHSMLEDDDAKDEIYYDL